ncbi:hypothetical protein ABT214_33445, partial [Micromonospora purpureochromogenes]|uniref:hypothetical protein n=1 Tax=Micromonospora purpureochromogenes TaxID=47872 RepID=UPI0033447530
LQARAAGAPPAADHEELPDLPAGGADGGEAAEQVAWLVRVARAYRSPEVARLRAGLGPATGTDDSERKQRVQ